MAAFQYVMSCFAVCCLHIRQHLELKYNLESDTIGAFASQVT